MLKSNFPLDKPFKRQKLDTPFSEVNLRLVVNFYSGSPYIIGTATILSGHLLITAKHVLQELYRDQGKRLPTEERVTLDAHIVAIQLLPGPEYVIWDVVEAIAAPVEDILLLRVTKNPGCSNSSSLLKWMCPPVNPFPPEKGEKIAAFGYREGKIKTSKNAHGGPHIDLDDEPIISVGIVQEIHEWRRDNCNLPFPCYQVNARFNAGMSGGAVYDETGALCGIICSGIDGAHLDGEPVSYVSTLWPLFRIIINFDRGKNYPRGVQYAALELARGGQIFVPDLIRLERWFEHYIGPPPQF